MRKKQLYVLSFLVIVTLGLGSLPPVSAAWSDWASGAVGDVSENSLPTYWTITSTPKTGYEQYLWSDWHSVVDSGLDLYSNEDYEMRFTTYHQTNLMGYIEFMSRETIEVTEEIVVRGRFGVKYSYAQVKTVGSIQIYDITTQTVAWSEPITTSTNPNTYKWVSFNSGPQPLDRTHDYKIRLSGTDAWKYQRVEVVWESVEVWFHAPYDSTLEHGSHSWRFQWPYMLYICNFESEFLFEFGPIDDMIRDHRPYVASSGLPWGWDPCYIHEFRSDPYYKLEGDDWYLTDMPGSVGYTDSSDWEEMRDGFEEVEVYTRNPESFETITEYFVNIRYQVWTAGSVEITLEAELGNEADTMALLSPPAMPVAWLVLGDTDVSHDYVSYRLWGFESNTGFLDNETASPVSWIQRNKLFDISAVGVYPHYLKFFTRLNIETSEDLAMFVRQKQEEVSSNIDRIPDGTKVPATITFDGLVSATEIVDLVKRYDMNVIRFRFTADNGEEIVRGQGTPSSNEIIPLEELERFISGYGLIGFQSIDVEVDSDMLEALDREESVLVLDIASFLFMSNAGISIADFGEVCWYTEDASWYLNYAFTA